AGTREHLTGQNQHRPSFKNNNTHNERERWQHSESSEYVDWDGQNNRDSNEFVDWLESNSSEGPSGSVSGKPVRDNNGRDRHQENNERDQGFKNNGEHMRNPNGVKQWWNNHRPGSIENNHRREFDHKNPWNNDNPNNSRNNPSETNQDRDHDTHRNHTNIPIDENELKELVSICQLLSAAKNNSMKDGESESRDSVSNNERHT
ncbi:unnamed protein product, partial [Meganyctiphanes norvegica]